MSIIEFILGLFIPLVILPLLSCKLIKLEEWFIIRKAKKDMEIN